MKKIISLLLLCSTILPFTYSNAEITISFADSTGFGTSDDTIQIKNIRVDTIISNPFDSTRPDVVSNLYNIPFTFSLTTLHLEPNLSAAQQQSTDSSCANLDVYVKDAYNGNSITSATVVISSNSVITDSSGTASFANLTSGQTSIQVSAPNYTTTTTETTLSCDTSNSIGAALNPTSGEGVLANGEFRVVLTWGENPIDLDSHLTGPNSSDESDRFHTYYSNKTGSDVATLDVDDVESYGPETITVSPVSGTTSLRDGVYRYSIQQYEGSGGISSSNAVVTLSLPDGTTRTFTPPSGATAVDDVWTVFEINVNSSGITVLTIDTISNNPSASSIRSSLPTGTGYGSVENGIRWDELPSK